MPKQQRPRREATNQSQAASDVAISQMRKILDSIVLQKEWTGGPTKKQKSIKTRIIAGRVPVSVINQIDMLGISRSYHLERALRLYLRVIAATSE